MKEGFSEENPMEKTRKEAAERAKAMVALLKAEGFDINIEEEPDTLTLEINRDGQISRLGMMKAVHFPDGKEIEEIIEEKVRSSEN